MFRENYKTPADARCKLFEWTEVEYNRTRAHSSRGYISPTKFGEDKMAKAGYGSGIPLF